jgi:hypothetical protein
VNKRKVELGIIVINGRYFPENMFAAANVGGTAFAFSIAACLDIH